MLAPRSSRGGFFANTLGLRGTTGVFSGNVDVAGILTAVGGVVAATAGVHTGSVTGATDVATVTLTASGAAVASSFTAPTISSTSAFGMSGIFTATATSPTAITSNQTNYASMGSTFACVLTSDGSYTMDGRGIASGQFQLVINGNTAARNFTFVHEGSGTNKYACPTAANYVLGPGQACWHFYDAAISRIRVIPMT